MSSIRRLKLCSLSRLSRMSKTLSDEINKLRKKVDNLEIECGLKLKDEKSVSLSINHGHYQTTIEHLENKIDSNLRQIDDLEEKREKIEEVRLEKYLQEKQIEKLGSPFSVKLKDYILFFLILLVLTLLVTEVYRIGVKGIGAEIHLTVEQGKVVDAEIIDSGREYEAVEVVAPTMTGDHAVLDISLESGSIRTVEVIHGGSGYINDFTPKLVPNFSRSTLWAFWIIDTLCCILFLINFFFELRLSDSKKWYWKTHWIDFITSIPLPPLHLLLIGNQGLGVIRAGRIFRVIRILRAVRILRMFLFLWRGMDHLSSVMDVKLLKRSLFYGIIALVLGALLFMTFEQVQTGKSFGSSLWWSFTTLVTGGFADIHNPTSIGGKILTVVLVIGGMVLVGVFTATLTSILVRDDDSLKQQDIDEQFRQLSNLGMLIKKIDQRLGRLEDKLNDAKND